LFLWLISPLGSCDAPSHPRPPSWMPALGKPLALLGPWPLVPYSQCPSPPCSWMPHAPCGLGVAKCPVVVRYGHKSRGKGARAARQNPASRRLASTASAQRPARR
jgi:hypothetical protein